ncbi:MAG: hypothetical protein VX768_08340 [Planctomycetota bacterium]|nr:hypothetical protein [Planctomycetota bacterium]
MPIHKLTHWAYPDPGLGLLLEKEPCQKLFRKKGLVINDTGSVNETGSINETGSSGCQG